MKNTFFELWILFIMLVLCIRLSIHCKNNENIDIQEESTTESYQETDYTLSNIGVIDIPYIETNEETTEESSENDILNELIGVELEDKSISISYYIPDYDTSKFITRYTDINDYNIDLLAKLLRCEAGGDPILEQLFNDGYTFEEIRKLYPSGLAMQIWTCSAILNYCDKNYCTLYSASHNPESFSVYDVVDYAIPLKQQYKVIDYVLNGHRIYNVRYFRSSHYHYFGTPIAKISSTIGTHYFSY